MSDYRSTRHKLTIEGLDGPLGQRTVFARCGLCGWEEAEVYPWDDEREMRLAMARAVVRLDAMPCNPTPAQVRRWDRDHPGQPASGERDAAATPETSGG